MTSFCVAKGYLCSIMGILEAKILRTLSKNDILAQIFSFFVVNMGQTSYEYGSRLYK